MENKTLFSELAKAGIEMASHESDLYFRSTPESEKILKEFPLLYPNASYFVNQTPPHEGQVWVDVPFAYLPYWESRGNNG